MDSANPIGFMQEFCVKNCIAFAKYEEGESSGLDHCRQFTCRCILLEHSVEGMGNSKKVAKREAATAMVKLLTDIDFFKNPSHNIANGNSEQNGHIDAQKNPVSFLQEYFQKRQEALPTYSENSATAPSLGFFCECMVQGKQTIGKGLTKKLAKVDSALKMLQELNINVEYINSVESINTSSKNPISQLMELCVKNKLPTPVFEDKMSPASVFTVKCSVGEHMAEGVGTNKQGAKTVAASKLLEILFNQGYSESVGNIKKWNSKSECENVESIKFDLDDLLPDYAADEKEEENIVSTSLAALSLEDTVVEIEPSTD